MKRHVYQYRHIGIHLYQYCIKEKYKKEIKASSIVVKKKPFYGVSAKQLLQTPWKSAVIRIPGPHGLLGVDYTQLPPKLQTYLQRLNEGLKKK